MVSFSWHWTQLEPALPSWCRCPCNSSSLSFAGFPPKVIRSVASVRAKIMKPVAQQTSLRQSLQPLEGGQGNLYLLYRFDDLLFKIPDSAFS